VSLAVIASPAKVEALASSGESFESRRFCSGVAAASLRVVAAPVHPLVQDPRAGPRSPPRSRAAHRVWTIGKRDRDTGQCEPARPAPVMPSKCFAPSPMFQLPGWRARLCRRECAGVPHLGDLAREPDLQHTARA